MERARELSDEQLLARTRSDRCAFGVFYGRNAVPLLAFLTRRVGSAELAADLTAETFAAALLAAPSFDPERGSASAWLYGIARHKVADAARTGTVESRARQRLGMAPIRVDDEALERVEALASLDVDARLLSDALDELPTAERSAIYGHVVRERSYADIAREVSTSPMVVRKRVSRGLARLRARLGVTL